MHSNGISFSGGFGATVAVMLCALGAVSLSLAAASSVAWYEDSVDAYFRRVQSTLDSETCNDMANIIRAKDPFVASPTLVQELGCNINQ